MEHVSQTDLEALRCGSISGARVLELVQHLESCEPCAARAVAASEMDRFARGLASILEVDEPQPASKPGRAIWYAVAAAAVVIAVLLMLRPPHPLPPSIPPPTPRPAARVDAGYGRADWDRLVGTALATRRVEWPATFAGMRADQYRGTTPAPRASGLSPSTTTIDDVRPQFRWPARPGQTYRVVVSLDDDIVVESPRLTAAPWRCGKDLIRGRVYRWQVIAGRTGILPKPPEPPALFKIASQRDHDDLAAAWRQFPHDDLLLGLLYARAGMEDEARAHLLRSPLAASIRGR